MQSWILSVPALVLSLIVAAVISACFRRRIISVAFLSVALVVNCYGEVIALHPFKSLHTFKCGEQLKVMTFNVNGPGDFFETRIDGIAGLVEDADPDVLFVGEIFCMYERLDDKLDSALKAIFPYSTYSGKTQWGNAFYSKHTIDTVQFLDITIGHSQPLATITVGSQKLSFLGCHLSSNNYVDPQTKLEVERISTKGEARQYLSTLEKGYHSRKQDVDSLCTQLTDIDKSNLIVLGDMNDIGGSYAIRGLESIGLKDGWWKGGFGLGGTRKVLGFPFRIDHILYGSGYKIKSAKVIDSNGLSDHNAVVARVDIKR